MVSGNVYSVHRKWGKTYKNTGMVPKIKTVKVCKWFLINQDAVSGRTSYSNVILQCFLSMNVLWEPDTVLQNGDIHCSLGACCVLQHPQSWGFPWLSWPTARTHMKGKKIICWYSFSCLFFFFFGTNGLNCKLYRVISSLLYSCVFCNGCVWGKAFLGQSTSHDFQSWQWVRCSSGLGLEQK